MQLCANCQQAGFTRGNENKAYLIADKMRLPSSSVPPVEGNAGCQKQSKNTSEYGDSNLPLGKTLGVLKVSLDLVCDGVTCHAQPQTNHSHSTVAWSERVITSLSRQSTHVLRWFMNGETDLYQSKSSGDWEEQYAS